MSDFVEVEFSDLSKRIVHKSNIEITVCKENIYLNTAVSVSDDILNAYLGCYSDDDNKIKIEEYRRLCKILGVD